MTSNASNKKQKRHDAIRARARGAISELYHNATVTYPHDVPEEYQGIFQSWFDDAVRNEIDYLNSGGAYAPSREEYRKILAHSANAGRYASPRAQAYYITKGLRDYDLEHSNPAHMWELINHYGQLYSYGRGGRTLAPDDLIQTRGGSSFSVNPDCAEEGPIESIVEMIQILESFNAYVAAWCKGVPDMWAEYLKSDVIADTEEAAILSVN